MKPHSHKTNKICLIRSVLKIGATIFFRFHLLLKLMRKARKISRIIRIIPIWQCLSI